MFFGVIDKWGNLWNFKPSYSDIFFDLQQHVLGIGKSASVEFEAFGVFFSNTVI